ncbi:AsmA family protein [Paludibacterium yongneupense]|uniref:AsmA family protein n=1 Tax=Paludibacterium yongneupense TaxID=400061 RepID=UPI001FE6B958
MSQTLIFWQFDEPAVRHALTDSLKDTGRKVIIDGSITPRIFPSPGLDVDRVTITEPDGKTPFAHIGRLEARLGWMALLWGNRQVKSLSLYSFDATIQRSQDGALSIADLFARRPQHEYGVRLDTLRLRDGSLSWLDRSNGQKARLDSVNLDADGLQSQGKVSAGAVLADDKQPLRLAINTPLTLQDDQLTFSHLEAVAMSDVEGLGQSRLLLEGQYQLNFATFKAGGTNAALTFSSEKPASQIKLTVPTVSAGLDGLAAPRAHLAGNASYGRSVYRVAANLVDVKILRGRIDATHLDGELNWLVGKHRVRLTLSAPFSLVGMRDLRLAPLTLSAQAITPLLPRGQLISTMRGSLDGNLDAARLNLHAVGTLDGSDIAVNVSQFGFIKPRHEATIAVGRLDLNRYLPEAKGDPVAIFQNPDPIPLEWLDFFDVSGKLTIGELNVGRFRVKDIATNVLATPRELDLDPMSANIYSGRLQGMIRLRRGEKAHIEVKQTLRGMNIRPLLLDLLSFSRLDGKGNGQVAVTAEGKSFADLRNTLSGDVQMSLNNGALTGIDMVAALKNLPAELKEWNAPAQPNQKTTFSTLQASFKLENGVGRNQDLKLASQLINFSGGGKVDLRQSIIDYTLDVQANPREFTSLKGINVPLKITGPINAPVYALDFNAMVKGKKTEGEKQQALKQELKKQITTILP